MSPPWWAALGPARATTGCGDGEHALLWAGGRLTAVDHPEAEEELVLAALGGDASPCLELIQAWTAHQEDLEVLALGPRSAADELAAAAQDAGEPFPWPRPVAAFAPRTGASYFSPGGVTRRRGLGRSGRGIAAARRQAMLARARARTRGRPATGVTILSHHPPTPSALFGSVGRFGGGGFARSRGPGGPRDRDEARMAELTRLFALGPAFQWRLSGTVAAAWSAPRAAHDRAAARPALTAALTGRLAPVAQAWLGVSPDLVEVSLHEGEGWGRLAVTGSGDQRRLTAALPVSWLARVWAPGLALVGGHLVLAVQEASWPRARVLALPEPGADPVVLSIRAGHGHWSVAPG